jgi:hypothetical protein
LLAALTPPTTANQINRFASAGVMLGSPPLGMSWRINANARPVQNIQKYSEQALLHAGDRASDVGRQAKIDQPSCHKVEQNNQPKTGRRWIIGTRK